jgi:hypothetical protein
VRGTRAEGRRRARPAVGVWSGDQRRAGHTEAALRLYAERHPDVSFRVTWQRADAAAADVRAGRAAPAVAARSFVEKASAALAT